jgi:hypothetical protein
MDNLAKFLIWLGNWGIIILVVAIIIAAILILAGQAQISFN